MTGLLQYNVLQYNSNYLRRQKIPTITYQSRGLRPQSYDKTGLRPASVLVL